MEFIVGQQARLKEAFKDPDGTLVDPTTVKFKFIPPSGSVTELVFGTDPEVVQESVGVYLIDLILNEVGNYYWRWETDGGFTTATEGQVRVCNSLFDEIGDIVVENGSGLTNANSYVSLVEAAEVLRNRLYADEWFDAAADTQISALIWATRLLDQEVNWMGHRKTSQQVLDFPRIGVFDDERLLDSDTIPPFLKTATAEFALELILQDRAAEEDVRGFSMLKIDRIEIRPDTRDRKNVLPLSVARNVERYGKVKSRHKATVKLARA